MAYISYEQVEADASVKDATDLTIPNNATHAELQSDTEAVRYTMDDTTNPSLGIGMLLNTADMPKPFLIEDIKRMKFTRGSGTAGNLNVHYFVGRNV